MNRKGSLCVWVVVCLLVAGGIQAEEGTTATRVDDSARSLAKSFAVKAAPLHQELDSGLNAILDDRSPLAKARDLGFKTRAEQIHVVLVTASDSAAEIKEWLVLSGATGVISAGDLVEAYVSVETLHSISADERVLFVRKPLYYHRGPEPEPFLATKAGSYQTQGVAAMNAGAWHSAGYSGEGFRVAVIDVGFEGYNGLLGSDLPVASRVFYADFTGNGMENSPHGTACAEIIHDIAPDANQMHLYVADTEVQVANAIATARTQGIDVISISLGTLVWGPGNGTGVIADAINTFTNAGGLVSVSAGNYRVGHWQGSWNDPESNGFLNYSGSVEVNYLTSDGSTTFEVAADEEISVQLVWNQWSAPATDLDLSLYKWNSGTEEWDQVAVSEQVQNGGAGQLPIEYISFTTTEAGYYGALVKHFSGPTSVEIELLIRPEWPLRAHVEQGSVSVPGDTASAISVAALDTISPYNLEWYSSRGPTNGPGGSLSGGVVKPDISGYANVSTAAYGHRSGGASFSGTSAACPHVAGAAALVWSANPSWTNTQVRSFLQNNAQDKGPTGKDNDYGYGRLYLGAPPSSCSYSISPTSRSFGSSGGSGTFSVSSQSGCSWSATTAQAWIHITGGSSGSGNGTVSFTVDTRSSTSNRSGTITVAGKTFTITQSGASSCSYSISPSSRSHTASGGTGSFSVTSGAGCSWSASSSNSWISVTGGSSGSGNGTVSYSVSSNSSSSSRSGTITVGGRTFSVSQSGTGGSSSSGDFTYFAVIAHTTGSNNSVWQSSLSVCNVSSSNASVVLTYRYGSSSVTRNVTIRPYGLAEWKDAPIDLFGVGGKSSGVVTIDSNARLLVAVRTFNSSVNGTFGQSLPGASSSVSMTNGQFGIISPLRRTTQFRTNIGVINTGSKSCVVEFVFGDTNGYVIGDPITMNLAPGEWKQTNEVLKKAGISRADGAVALVRLQTAGAEVWAYATVIDNWSGDPTALGVAIFD
jgi:subtilisin family serine protease